jgi:hypothetical protein
VGIAKAGSEARVVELLHGWHVYLGFAIVGIGLFIGFVRWNRKY